MQQIFDQTLGSDTATIDTGANGIPSSGAALWILLYLRSSEATVRSGTLLRINGDATSNYYNQEVIGRASTASAFGSVLVPQVGLDTPGTSVDANVFMAGSVWIPNYAGTVGYKSVVASCGWANSNTANNDVYLHTGTWLSTSAINRLSITAGGSANLVTGSRMTIFIL